MLCLLTGISSLLIFTLLVHSPAFFPKPLLISPVLAVANTWFLCRPTEWKRSPCWMQSHDECSQNINRRKKTWLAVWLLVKWVTWRWSEVCVQPRCNRLWLTGLKSPTNLLTNPLITYHMKSNRAYLFIFCPEQLSQCKFMTLSSRLFWNIDSADRNTSRVWICCGQVAWSWWPLHGEAPSLHAT